MTELKALVARRGILKGQLTKFGSFLDEIRGDKSRIDELKFRLNKLEDVWSKFSDVQTEIELIDSTDAQIEERDEFDNKYYKYVACAQTYLDGNHAQNVSNDVQIRKKITLPQINLPEFSGSYDTWYSFHDTFNTLIHSDKNLSNIQKYQYLRSSLKGEAAQVIQSLEISENNYETAWDLLKKRFDNRKIIIKSHVKAIVDLPSVNNSSTTIRQFTDNFQKHYRALKNLDLPVDSWDTMLIYLLTNKLDANSKREWEIETNDKDCPTTIEFMEFLNKRCRILESLDNKQPNYTSNVKRSDIKTHAHTLTNLSCPICKESHYIFYCEKFLNMNMHKRLSEIKRLNLCINCLKKGHNSKKCQSRGCKRCNIKHNTLLHFETETSESNTEFTPMQSRTSSTSPNAQVSTQSSTETHPTVQTNTVTNQNGNISNALGLLSTAVIYVCNARGVSIEARCLLDNGSQSNFMTHDLFKKLNLKPIKINMPVVGINSIVTNICSQTFATISSLHSKYIRELKFLIIDKITDHTPQFSFSSSHWNIPQNIKLADPRYFESDKIDMLSGVEVFYDLLKTDQIKLGKNQPILQNSALGWIISGLVTPIPTHSTQCNLSTNLDIQNQIEKFWLIEQGSVAKVYTKEEEECEENFVNTFHRNIITGRFSVNLPLCSNYSQLGNSVTVAENRFYSLERKLSKNPNLKSQYCKFMEEYKLLGHMSKIDSQHIANSICYYLPHHCVQNDGSITTKLRVVFDGSSKTDSGLSLNDVLKTGPSIQDELYSILIRLRKHKIMIIADIEKMYRQIEVTPEHRNLQRIVWRSDPSKGLEHFTLNTVTYGTSPASFLSIRCLKQLAIENVDKYPTASQIILNDFYVDDLITGCSDKDSARNLIHDLDHILKGGCFNLRKWSSNDPSIFSELSDSSNLQNYIISGEQSCKTLGLLWNPKEDAFRYSTNSNYNTSKPTKRQILSIASQIFDPLGLLCPIIIRAKVLMQQLWRYGLDWDDEVPTDVAEDWSKFIHELPGISHISIPRKVIVSNYKRIEIHAFSDASQVAYGTCIYLRSIRDEGKILVRLLTAKSRVAPIKTLTIPRLELCGALLMARLVERIITVLKLDMDSVKYYTDSTIVLAWLKLEPGKLKQFVAHRVAELQELTSVSQWAHVCSQDNPADIISRGTDPLRLLEFSLWWNGPSWLHSDSNLQYNQINEPLLAEAKVPELKVKTLSHACTTPFQSDIFTHFSSFTKLQRITAYCLRFVNNWRKPKNERHVGKLSIAELNFSLRTLIKLAQAEEFSIEFHLLHKAKPIPRNSKLISINPFLDKDGLLRVGGRLKHSNLAYDHKFPIILPSKHIFTQLLIEYEHKRNLHSGIQTTLASIRTKYWPIHGKQVVRKVLRSCITCFKCSPYSFDQKMSDLPSPRVTASRPFSVCGIDYAGPFLIRDGKLRNRQCVKGYLCIFVCFVTKAVHLELATDLSTTSFLNALRRFVSRRGLCQEIFSDNATNFRGADNELKRLHKICTENSIHNFLTEHEIKWNFIPPRSPHHGGLWEAAVKTAKYHLQRICKDSKLTYEEFITLLCHIEAIMNSRPLYPLSTDPSDIEPLTPGHFLIGTALNSLPQADIASTNKNLLTRYEYIQNLTQQFWKTWSRQYLHHLQQRSKWRLKKDVPNLLGALVLLKEDFLPPQRWCLGRIVAIHPGEDQEVRVVSVKTNAGVFKRAISKLQFLKPLRCFKAGGYVKCYIVFKYRAQRICFWRASGT